jgi:glycerol uptake facilitator-like aquaporin
MIPALRRRLVAEFLGTAGLLLAVVGSGIMGERLAGGDTALALLANSLATGATLVALILSLGAISGAHFNPAVTCSVALQKSFPWRAVPGYIVSQITGAFAGVITAHMMFGLPVLSASRHVRSGAAQIFSEGIAMLGLLLVIALVSRTRSAATPYALAAYIVGAYWFTSSTSFANPAATLARSLSDTFAGIRPADVPGFLLGEIAGTIVAVPIIGWLLSEKSVQEMPHAGEDHRHAQAVGGGDDIVVAD